MRPAHATGSRAPRALARAVAGDRHLLTLLAVAAVVAGFYVWTAATSADLAPRHDVVEPYNALTDAFLSGHVHLNFDPPAALQRLPNPYDPAANEPFRDDRLRDLSLYDGRYFAYWGPTPVLVLLAPFRALGLGELPPADAVLAFSLLALGSSLALLRLLQRRLAPQARPWMLGAAAAAVGLGNVAPFMLRRPTVYETAITAGLAFLLAGLALMASAMLRERPSVGRLVAASGCFGLAFGARPPLGLAGALLIVAIVAMRRSGALRSVRAPLLVLAPFAACVLAYGAYNAVRFGSPLEFGQRYQIAGYDFSKSAFFNPGYVLPNLWFYVVAPAVWRLQFPYFWLPAPPGFPGHLPAAYAAYDPAGGLLPDLPLLLMLGALPWVLPRGRPRQMLLAGVGLGLVLLAFVTFYLGGAAQRYEADFATLLLLPATLVWLRWMSTTRRRSLHRRVVAIAGGALAAYGTVVSVAVSVTGNEGTLLGRHPRTFRALESFFSPLPTLATQIAGRPMIASVAGNTRVPGSRIDHIDLDRTALEAGITPGRLDVVAPRDELATVEARIVRRAVVPEPTQIRLRIDNGATTTYGPPAIDGQVQRVPVTLRRGLNDLAITVRATPAVPIAPDDYRIGALVGLEDVRLRPPAT